jgi:anhydro-N-acetylmuramic acid kinase
MVYKVIGVMSGSSLDGVDIAYVEFEENGGKWSYTILETDCQPYENSWQEKLAAATGLAGRDYQLLHTEYGHYLADRLVDFISSRNLHFKVSLISCHGHTTFHMPDQRMTAQLGDGAAIAVKTQLPVVSDLRAMDIALGGQGAPIIPIGEKLLWEGYHFFLNLGGIANISLHENDKRIAFDVCPANRVLNMLASLNGKAFDEGGRMAATGKINSKLMDDLNALPYYKKSHPKSLANDFGTDIVFPLINKSGLTPEDALRTYSEHIALQVSRAFNMNSTGKMLVTGGGALNSFLVSRIAELVAERGIETEVPDNLLVNYKEAVVMALIGVLRWRQENNVLSSVTGAARDSIGGALWMGHDYN